MKRLYTAQVDVDGGRAGHARSSDGKLHLTLALQEALGGSGAGTNPEQLLAAGWGACFASTIAQLARVGGQPVDHVSVHAEIDIMQGEAGYALVARLKVRAPSATAGRLRVLIEQAKVACPYSRSLQASVPTTYEVMR